MALKESMRVTNKLLFENTYREVNYIVKLIYEDSFFKKLGTITHDRKDIEYSCINYSQNYIEVYQTPWSKNYFLNVIRL